MDALATSTPLQNGNANHDAGAGDAPVAAKGKPKGLIEKIYQKKSQLEHILLRPDTYIGSVEPVTELMWVYNQETECMIQREITYVPGLYKIFDEILVNAADNKQRDPHMDCIKITINPQENVISVWNNGKGIPVVEHKDEKMYVPTMIFGHLLTSSNYNDEEQKVTGGRNGFGAKLCNIFSTKFVVETSSKEYKRKFKQSWTNNMSKTTAPAVKEAFDDYTKITFSPDLSKFKMETLDRDIVDLMSRRAYDVAASSRGVRVFLNDHRLPVKNFRDYINLYIKGKEDENQQPLKVIHELVNDRWEVGITSSEFGFRQVSFVNSIATTKGGRHVEYVSDAIVKHLLEIMKKKHKNTPIKPFQIKNHLWIFINCLIVNPTFDSQTKENMTLQAKNFGSKCSLSDKFFQQVAKSSIVDAVLSWAKNKQDNQLQKTSGKKHKKLSGVPKLEDANDAGTKNSIDCTLILTEGDSAKALAVSGLGVVGRDKYGVFPLRGKLLNVREASHKQIMENAEINNIVKIVGLQYKKKYETIDDLKTLRYGKIMIMTDQDQDGSHIKGLIINFIHHNWPSLLKLPFLEEFITPIIKATKGEDGESLSFFSIPEFEEWKNQTDNWHTYKIKYYKGLGTSTSKEAKEYFSNMLRHRIIFKHRSDDDDSHITMAFSKKMVDARKDWLTNWMTESKRRKELGLGEDYLYGKLTREVTYKDFINKELVLFSNMDNERSIPSMIDGFKPGSRKVIFTCFKRNDKTEIKVAQLAGSVAEHSAYHHGETSLMSTIINLAQNFVGSNNINLLKPNGQFGTRLNGGKDAASPRYIFTMLSPLARLIFHPHDDPLLTYLRDDNLKIEPLWYMPIIPMVLVNGAEGIGTGWMTKIPNHNPREIIENLHRMIRGDEPLPMKPWYKNFLGEIERLGETRFVTNGEVGILSDEKLEITELPVGTWTQSYKESVLETMLNGGGEKSPACISDYKEYNTDTTVKFVVMMQKEKLKKFEFEGLHKVFKLQSSFAVTSMCAFDKDGVLRRYESTTHILKEFFEIRLEFYNKRKKYLVGMLEAEANKLSNQARFILEKCDGDLRIENRKKKEMIAELIKRKFDSDPVKAWKYRVDKESALEDEEPEETEEDEASKTNRNEDYDYLLGMTLWSLTQERKNDLLRKRDDKLAELEILKKKSPSDLWVADLDALLAKLDEVEQKERDDEAGIKKKGGKMLKEKLSKKKKLALTTDSLPSPHAIRVVPKYDELMKKAVKAVAAKENKGKRTAKKKLDKIDDNEEDMELGSQDSQGTQESLESPNEKPKPAKKEPKEKKQPAKKQSPAKKSTYFASDLDDDESSNSDDAFDSKPIAPTTPVRKTARAAAQKCTFKEESDESDFDDLLDADAVPTASEQPEPAAIEDSSDAELLNITESSDDSDFDLDIEHRKKKPSTKKAKILDDSDAGTKGKKKPAKATTKRAAPKKKTAVEEKPKNERAKAAPAKKKAAAKKKIDSEESDDLRIEDSSEDESKQKKGEKRKADSNSDSDDFLFGKRLQNDEMSADDKFDSLFKSESKKPTSKPAKPVKSEYSFEPSVHSLDYTSDSDYAPTTSSKSKKAPPKKARTAKKKKLISSDEDSDY